MELRASKGFLGVNSFFTWNRIAIWVEHIHRNWNFKFKRRSIKLFWGKDPEGREGWIKLVRIWNFNPMVLNIWPKKGMCEFWRPIELLADFLSICKCSYSQWQNWSKMPFLVKNGIFICKFSICASKWRNVSAANSEWKLYY